MLIGGWQEGGVACDEGAWPDVAPPPQVGGRGAADVHQRGPHHPPREHQTPPIPPPVTSSHPRDVTGIP